MGDNFSLNNPELSKYKCTTKTAIICIIILELLQKPFFFKDEIPHDVQASITFSHFSSF